MNFNRSVSCFLFLFMGLFLVSCNSQEEDATLKDTFKNNYLIGTAVNMWQVTGKDEKSIEVLKKHFNSITPENCMKWEKIHPEVDEYNFESADKFVEFGEANNMVIIGHTLIWHSQTPSWVFEDKDGNALTRDALLARMKDHIFTVVGRYKGRVHGWDVVNEAFNEDGTMRDSKWLNIIGDDFLEKAFQWAHEADPDAELYYNDFNMWYPGKRDRVVKFVNEMKDKGIRIDGIGVQGHWGLDYPPMDEADAAFSAYEGTGLGIMVTELDMAVLPLASDDTGADISQNYELQKQLNPYPEGLPDSMIVVQSNRFTEFFKLFNKYKDSVTRVTLWGISDASSWRNNWPVRGRTAYPLLFDRNYLPKPAVKAIIKTVE